jgi:hypothetical protein
MTSRFQNETSLWFGGFLAKANACGQTASSIRFSSHCQLLSHHFAACIKDVLA